MPSKTFSAGPFSVTIADDNHYPGATQDTEVAKYVTITAPPEKFLELRESFYDALKTLRAALEEKRFILKDSISFDEGTVDQITPVKAQMSDGKPCDENILASTVASTCFEIAKNFPTSEKQTKAVSSYTARI